MPIPGKKYKFHEKNIGKSPDVHGVYALFDGDVLIYYGRALGASQTIRSQLKRHKDGGETAGTQLATHYAREKTEHARKREGELLAEYKIEHQALPRCNADSLNQVTDVN